jgi:hypothetical protein
MYYTLKVFSFYSCYRASKLERIDSHRGLIFNILLVSQMRCLSKPFRPSCLRLRRESRAARDAVLSNEYRESVTPLRFALMKPACLHTFQECGQNYFCQHCGFGVPKPKYCSFQHQYQEFPDDYVCKGESGFQWLIRLHLVCGFLVHRNQQQIDSKSPRPNTTLTRYVDHAILSAYL